MSDMKMNKQLGTKWFTFYTKIRPWFACLMVFSVIDDFMQYTDVYVSNWWMLLYFAVAIAQPILSVIVAVKSSGDYVDFVCFVKGVLLFETINMSYQQGVKQYIKSELEIGSALIMFAIVFVISYFVWYRLNVKYFEKRINPVKNDRFEDNSNRITECMSCGYRDENFFHACPKCGKYAKQYIYLNEEPTVDTDKVLFCHKCGAKLIENSRFCRKCGTEIVEEPAVIISEPDNCEFCKKYGADITNDSDTCHVCGEQKGTD
jgi:ribosomal protein L40E